MMRTITRTFIAVTIMLLSSTAAMATDVEQERSIGNWRWCLEMGACMDFLQDGLPQFCQNKLGGGMYYEARYHIGQTPFNVGLYASLNTAPRRYSSAFEQELLDESDAPIGRVTLTHKGGIRYGSGNVMATINYDVMLGRRCEAFVGAGIGICNYVDNRHWMPTPDQSYLSDTEYRGSGISLSVMPRVGIQLFEHLRLTAGYKFQEKANRHAFVSIGLVGFIGKRK